MRRAFIMMAVVGLLISLSACQVRGDLTAGTTPESTTVSDATTGTDAATTGENGTTTQTDALATDTESTTTQTQAATDKTDASTTTEKSTQPPAAPQSTKPSAAPQVNMSQYAWELYQKLVEADSQLRSYDIQYTTGYTANSQTLTSSSRIIRKESGSTVEALVTLEGYQGYYKDGVGYFLTPDDRYWMYIDEINFFAYMGLAQSGTMTQEDFAQALVAENSDGGHTVSCPMSGEAAQAYAEMTGLAEVGWQVKSLEQKFVTDKNGAMTEYATYLTVVMEDFIEMRVEDTARYLAKDQAVTVTPPGDLETYRDGNGMMGYAS